MQEAPIAAGLFETSVELHGRQVLDPCCGGRMMWFGHQYPDVVFGDRRSETLTVTDRSHGNESRTRTLRIKPDELLNFRARRPEKLAGGEVREARAELA